VYARHTLGVLPRSLAGTGYAAVPAVLPEVVERAAFPPLDAVLPGLLGGLAVALAAGLAAGARRRHGLLLWAALVVAGAAVAGVLAGLMYSAGEYGRFGIQEAVLLRLAVLVLAVAAVDTALLRGADLPRGATVPGGAELPGGADLPRGATRSGPELARRDWIPTQRRQTTDAERKTERGGAR
jgi:hypothetical protein